MHALLWFVGAGVHSTPTSHTLQASAIERVHINNLDCETFLTNYVATNVPLILMGATAWVDSIDLAWLANMTAKTDRHSTHVIPDAIVEEYKRIARWPFNTQLKYQFAHAWGGNSAPEINCDSSMHVDMSCALHYSLQVSGSKSWTILQSSSNDNEAMNKYYKGATPSTPPLGTINAATRCNMLYMPQYVCVFV